MSAVETKRTLLFDQWMRHVDAYLWNLTDNNLRHDDLPDWRYRDAYDEGMSAKVAATKALKHAMEF